MPKVPLEVTIEQYELKATFVSNRLETLGYVGLFDRAGESLAKIGKDVDWSERASFGIKEEAFKLIRIAAKDPALYFCHPNILTANPTLLSYYRCLSTFSQKGLVGVSGVSSVPKIENKAGPCSADQAVKLARAINLNLSAIFSTSLPNDEKLKAILYATAGMTIDGSWRNAIGDEGERLIRALFLTATFASDEIANVTQKNGKTVEASYLTAEWLDTHANQLKSAMFVNGSVAQFASEPDITLIRPDGVIAAGIEIKAGIDPAGALERLGAMMKSFNKILLSSPSAETILVATCITEEVSARLAANGNNRTFILTDIVQNHKNRGTELMTIFRRRLCLVD